MSIAKPYFASPLQPATPGAEPEPPSGCYATDNPHTIRKVLHEFISTKKNLNLPTFISDESNVSRNASNDIAEAFNEHFSDIGDEHGAKI